MCNHLVVVALLALAAAGTDAVSAQESTLKDQLAEFTTDLSVPASPAAAHVGLSQEGVLMPRNRRSFEAGLSQIVSAGGKPVGTIEFAPYYIARGPALQYTRYRDEFWFRALTKTTLGVASGKRKVESTELSATGYSVSSVLIDLGDPVYSHALQLCINRVQQAGLERAKKAASKTEDAEDLPDADDSRPFDASDEREDPEALKAYKACISKREPELWNRTRVSVGFAKGSGRETASPKRRIDFGESLWLSAQYGFEDLSVFKTVFGSGDRFVDCPRGEADKACPAYAKPGRLERNAMATLHLRHVRGASDLDLSVAGELPRYDSTVAALRFSYGSDKRNVFIEASRAWVKTSAANRRTEQHAFGASFQVSEGLWINAVNGRRKSYLNGTLENVTELNLQFGGSQTPVIAPGKPQPGN
jgi:hypothetical protein